MARSVRELLLLLMIASAVLALLSHSWIQSWDLRGEVRVDNPPIHFNVSCCAIEAADRVADQAMAEAEVGRGAQRVATVALSSVCKSSVVFRDEKRRTRRPKDFRRICKCKCNPAPSTTTLVQAEQAALFVASAATGASIMPGTTGRMVAAAAAQAAMAIPSKFLAVPSNFSIRGTWSRRYRLRRLNWKVALDTWKLLGERVNFRALWRVDCSLQEIVGAAFDTRQMLAGNEAANSSVAKVSEAIGGARLQDVPDAGERDLASSSGGMKAVEDGG